MKNYKLLRSVRTDELEKLLNEHIKSGYILEQDIIVHDGYLIALVYKLE